MEIQAVGQLLSLVASCHISGRIGGKAKDLVLAKVKSKGPGVKGMTESLISNQMVFQKQHNSN